MKPDKFDLMAWKFINRDFFRDGAEKMLAKLLRRVYRMGQKDCCRHDMMSDGGVSTNKKRGER